MGAAFSPAGKDGVTAQLVIALPPVLINGIFAAPATVMLTALVTFSRSGSASAAVTSISIVAAVKSSPLLFLAVILYCAVARICWAAPVI